MRLITFEKMISSLELKGTARTRPDILKVVLGPYVQYCPCEASEQKLGQKPEFELKVIELSYCHHSHLEKKECQNWTKNDHVMPNLMFLWHLAYFLPIDDQFDRY